MCVNCSGEVNTHTNLAAYLLVVDKTTTTDHHHHQQQQQQHNQMRSFPPLSPLRRLLLSIMSTLLIPRNKQTLRLLEPQTTGDTRATGRSNNRHWILGERQRQQRELLEPQANDRRYWRLEPQEQQQQRELLDCRLEP